MPRPLLSKQYSDTPGEGVEIALQPWQPDSPYARRLRDAAPDQVYALYLEIDPSRVDVNTTCRPSGVQVGFLARIRAAAPETTGAENDVPDIHM